MPAPRSKRIADSLRRVTDTLDDQEPHEPAVSVARALASAVSLVALIA